VAIGDRRTVIASTVGADPPDRPAEALAAVRRTVRTMLESTPGYSSATPERRRALAKSMVNVSMMAANLLAEDRELTARARERARPRPLSTALSAGEHLGKQGVESVGDLMARTRDNIDFPTYVTSLITGVFQAILSSSTQQIGELGDLLDNVSATSEEFESIFSDGAVAQWTAAKFPFMMPGQDGELQLRPGVDLTGYEAQLQRGLGASPDEVAGIDADDLSGTLLPLARRKMGRDRQGALATMVQMGLQRIVVDEGRLHASMDLRLDAESASQQDLAQRDDWRVNARAAGSFGGGLWMASAGVNTSIGKVKSDHQYTAEQVAVRAGLRSSVELAFRTEQVPLDRLADANARVKIGQNARVPADVSSGGMLRDIRTGFGPVSIDSVPATPFPEAPPVAPAAPRAPAPGAPAPGGPAPGAPAPGAPAPGGPGAPAPGAPAPGGPGAPAPGAQPPGAQPQSAGARPPGNTPQPNPTGPPQAGAQAPRPNDPQAGATAPQPGSTHSAAPQAPAPGGAAAPPTGAPQNNPPQSPQPAPTGAPGAAPGNVSIQGSVPLPGIFSALR
jgi:hypothetical protein